jgi:hypothetical protein
MFADQQALSPTQDALYAWARHHKTMICLNGGNHADITQLYMVLRSIGAELSLPVGIFYEDDISLNRAATAVGIVVPEYIYAFASLRDIDEISNYTPRLTAVELQLADTIKSYPLAR